MTGYIRFKFPETLVHSNIFRLGLFRAFYEACVAQNKLPTELNSPISAVYFSFATIFQYLNFVQFRSYSDHKISYECSLQWSKPFVDIFFIFEKLGSKYWRHSKKALILSSESANMLIRGVVKFPVAIKFMGKKGEYQDFLSKHFCLRVLKNFVGEHFSVS